MRVLVTGLGTFWGSRIAQAPRAASRRRARRRRRHPRAAPAARRAPSSCRPTRRTRSCAGSCAPRRSTPCCTRTSSSTPPSVSSRRAARGQRHRHDEPARRGRGATGSPVRKIVLKTLDARLRLELRRPVLLPRDDPAHAPADARRSSGRCSRSTRWSRDFAEDHPEVSVTSLRFANVLGDDVDHRVLAHAAHARGARGLRLRPAAAVRARGRRHPRPRARDRRASTPGTFNVAGPGTITWGEACRAGRPAAAGHAAAAHRAARPRRCGCCASSTSRRRCCSLLRYGRGVDTDAFVATGFEYGYTTPATVEAFARARGSSASSARRPPTSTSARSRTSSATRARWCNPRPDRVRSEAASVTCENVSPRLTPVLALSANLADQPRTSCRGRAPDTGSIPADAAGRHPLAPSARRLVDDTCPAVPPQNG